MVFACQRDSFLREFKAKVLSCTESEINTIVNGKNETMKGYDVIMEDTILFPEGGGQPCDQGFLDSVEVIQVTRHGEQAVHFVTKPVQEGNVVEQRLDWKRRFDHMQQHSGQHLISAIGETVFKYATTAWWLGEESSYIELDTTQLTQSEVEKWENIVNDKIRAGLDVSVSVFERDDPSLTEAHTRGLPDDHVGLVRVINIEGVDSNMCCGTHVTCLSQLQVIKMLHFEKGKRNKTNLHFLVGNRVIDHMASMMNRESSLTALLKNGPSLHVDLVEKLQKSMKVTNKKLTSVLKDLAVHEAHKFLAITPCPKFYALHRSDGDSDFMRIFVNEIGNQTETLLVLTVGDEKGAGQMVMNGEPKLVSELGPKVCEILEGKGAGKGSKFQAKVFNLSKRSVAETIIKDHLKKLEINDM